MGAGMSETAFTVQTCKEARAEFFKKQYEEAVRKLYYWVKRAHDKPYLSYEYQQVAEWSG